MQVKDITDRMVFDCFAQNKAYELSQPYVILQERGYPEKVVLRKLEAMVDNGYFDYGVSIRNIWLTEKGVARKQELSDA